MQPSHPLSIHIFIGSGVVAGFGCVTENLSWTERSTGVTVSVKLQHGDAVAAAGSFRDGDIVVGTDTKLTSSGVGCRPRIRH